MSNNTPVPSQLCLLSALPSRAVRDKVRFLGCVKSYSAADGVLTLEHSQNTQTRHTPFVRALVDVNLVLEGLKAEQTSTGEWVNVIGYITSILPLTDGKGPSHGMSGVEVQALVLWSARPLDMTRYETSVNALGVKRNSDHASDSLSDNLLQTTR
ncbi:CST complex subunit Ten1 [Podospora appendiculata]|uniref:CST complex subunit Ten1 n=1 Tax=Podospora appendiculata TaxID=314037 RepID=A0AAE0X504_9PEZI|nr:CST complex subunit Ten1 [Podospora appendiculata]